MLPKKNRIEQCELCEWDGFSDLMVPHISVSLQADLPVGCINLKQIQPELIKHSCTACGIREFQRESAMYSWAEQKIGARLAKILFE